MVINTLRLVIRLVHHCHSRTEAHCPAPCRTCLLSEYINERLRVSRRHPGCHSSGISSPSLGRVCWSIISAISSQARNTCCNCTTTEQLTILEDKLLFARMVRFSITCLMSTLFDSCEITRNSRRKHFIAVTLQRS